LARGVSGARLTVAIALAAALGIGAGGEITIAAAAAKPSSATLSIWRSGAWRGWWWENRAPARWTAADTLLTGALKWSRIGPGLEWASLRLACPAPAWRARLIIARVDPRATALSLEMDLDHDQHPAEGADLCDARRERFVVKRRRLGQ
jgi:hypothetical protein